MNYLAHLFLSGNDEDLRLGNFIADGVRGAQILLYPARVQEGIRLHRLIDSFTDSHPVVTHTKERLRPKFRKYAGVVADVFYDHFLASDFHLYSQVSLQHFAAEAYAQIQAKPDLLPERVQHFLPYMVTHNWLVSYAQISGISKALRGLSSRATFESGMEKAGEELELNYPFYRQDFEQFFPDLQAYVAQQIELRIKN
ncbi:acyl carrier protein phosphodiesterase [Rufibacter roseolus]|uniref:acyl carrier protein phosphodiesterase n=1 Tax=Rufibacter roseolus TaxID=2817375 RepID=UPI001B3151AD|nr:ACP phosphodiesterase [Rufibacter roseolus]